MFGENGMGEISKENWLAWCTFVIYEQLFQGGTLMILLPECSILARDSTSKTVW